MVEHAFAIDADETVERADEMMQATQHEFAAVVSDGRVIGTCSRGKLRQMVGGRYGFALHARRRLRDYVEADGNTFNSNTSLRELLDLSLAREDEKFYHDIVIVDGEQRLVGLVSTLRLVRAQSQIMADQNLQLNQQRDELEQVNTSLRESLEQQRALERRVVQEAKSALLQTLAGGIAHEINNKLVPIIGYSEMMAEEAGSRVDREFEGYCVTIRTAALESAQIIRQLLELSKPPAPALVRLDLREPVEMAMTFTHLLIKESDTAFELDLPEGAVIVLADATQIKQLVVNLVLNAIDAMGASAERRLLVRLTASGEIATLLVRDSGDGIPAGGIDRIFDPFYTTKRPDKGTGLGLSVCSSIARQHHGEISVESEVGRGSTFKVTLPLGLASSLPQAAAPESASRAPGAQGREYHGLSALVADDEAASGQLVKRALEHAMGLDVEWVPDGEAAVERLRQRDYALVVSDMRMPKLGGMELLAWVTEHRPRLASRILFITGDEGAEGIEALERGGALLLLKPFKLGALTTACRTILAQGAPPS